MLSESTRYIWEKKSYLAGSLVRGQKSLRSGGGISIYLLHPSDANANTMSYLALWSDSHTMKRAGGRRWIGLNEFSTHLTMANVCNCTHNMLFLFEDILDKSRIARILSCLPSPCARLLNS